MTPERHMGDYTLIAEIGQGGMGNVYLAVKRGPAGMRKLLVLKGLRPHLAEDPEFLAMFFDEARLAARLHHPNVVQCYEVYRHKDSLFLVMEYLEGQPLGRIMARQRRDPRPDWLRFSTTVLCEALAGLHYAHELCDFDGTPLCMVHRDVSPQNVFVTYSGEVKLMDFGIAKALDSRTETLTGTFKGKLAYIAPEQLREGSLDARGDVFSAGVILWEILTGQRMWKDYSDAMILKRLSSGSIPKMPQVAVNAPSVLQTLCEQTIEVNPYHRIESAAGFRSELLAAQRSFGGAMDRDALGKYLLDMFEAERCAVRSTIEEQLMIVGERRSDPPAESRQSSRHRLPLLVWPPAEGATPSSGRRESWTRDSCESWPPEAVDDITVDYDLPVAQKRRRRPSALAISLALSAIVAAVLALVLVVNPRTAAEDFDRLSPSGPNRLTFSEVEVGRAVDSSGNPLVELTGDINQDTVLTNDKRYLLTFSLNVRRGAALIIQKGTTILGDTVTKGALIVHPGASLVASGTKDEPIVFTSAASHGNRKPGDWGGVVLLGEAPTNLKDESGAMRQGRVEGLIDAPEYGGSNPDDSSGILEYMVIEYAGVRIAPNNELNGLTLAGVGRLTKLHHIVVRDVLDDCFQFFGGTVDGRHLVCIRPGDDAFEWDYGYSGRLQFLLAVFGPNAEDGCNGFEGSNDPRGSEWEPRSSPVIYNATLCGGGSSASQHYGILGRKNTSGVVANTIVTGFAAGLDIRDRGTSLSVMASVFHDNHRAVVAYPERPGGLGVFADDDFGYDEMSVLRRKELPSQVADPGLTGCGRFFPDGHKPPRAFTKGAATPPDDGFFDVSAAFAGAFRDRNDNWDEGPWMLDSGDR